MLIALVLLAQVLTGPQAYTVADPDQPDVIDLAMDNGLYRIELGMGCDSMVADLNVEWLPGSNNVGAIVPVGTTDLCNIYISGKINDTPCAMNDDGVCDVAMQ